MVINLVINALCACGGAVFSQLAAHGKSVKQKELIRTLQEEVDALQACIEAQHQANEIMHMRVVVKEAESVIDNTADVISAISYAFCIKEYIEIKTAILLGKDSISLEEGSFLDAFSMVIRGTMPTDENGTVSCAFIKEYINNKYSKEIASGVKPDLDEIMSRLALSMKETCDDIGVNTDTEENHYDFLEPFKLSFIQTNILYSLEYNKIEEDITKTKDETKRVLKRAWQDKWISSIRKEFDQKFTLYKNTENLRNIILKELSLNEDKTWFYIVFSEAAEFRPYQPLDSSEEDKKVYKRITLCRGVTYVKNLYDECCTDDCHKSFLRDYASQKKKYYNNISGNTQKTVITAVSAIVLGVASFGAAYIFAPGIAVALAGSTYAGLHGVVLTNACLAFFGGGALAAGGLGMAGGTMAIAGGGALLGLLGGGVSSTIAGNVIYSAPEVVTNEFAKILATTKCIILDINNDMQSLAALSEDIKEEIARLEVNIPELGKSDDVEKKVITRMKKSLDVMKRADKLFKEFLQTE